MRTQEAMKVLLEWDRRGRYVYTRRDLAKLFDDPSDNALSQTLRRLVDGGFLVHVGRDVYVFAQSANIGATTIEEVAATLRRGELVFESLESALSQWGRISQILIDRITCLATGRRGEFSTPFGVIEFTHTERPVAEIAANIIERPGHPLPIANEAFAIRNLLDVHRNLDLLEQA